MRNSSAANCQTTLSGMNTFKTIKKILFDILTSRLNALRKVSSYSSFLTRKMSESQTKAGNQECFEKLEKLSLSLLSLLSQLSLSHSLSLDMLNNFCFHVYAQKSLFKVENVNAYFLTSSSSLTSAPREFANHRAGSQLKIFFHISPLKTVPEDKL